MMRNRVTPWVAFATVLVALVLISTMDYHDAERERDHYCDMVRDGAWPDYRGTYAEECAE